MLRKLIRSRFNSRGANSFRTVGVDGATGAMAKPPRAARGCSSMVEQKPSKLTTRVRFPSPAPPKSVRGTNFCGTLSAAEGPSTVREQFLCGARRAKRGSDLKHAMPILAASHASVRLTAPRRQAIGPAAHRGEVAEWLKAADCKSARASVRWFESSPLHHRRDVTDSSARFGSLILHPNCLPLR